MSEPIPFHLQLSSEIVKAMHDQGVDLVDQLQALGLDVKRGTAPDPTRGPDGSKSAVPIILSSGVSAYLLGLAVVKVAKAILGRPVIGNLGELKAVLDGHGNPVLEDGKPKFYWSGERQLLDPTLVPHEPKTNIKVAGLIEVKVDGT